MAGKAGNKFCLHIGIQCQEKNEKQQKFKSLIDFTESKLHTISTYRNFNLVVSDSDAGYFFIRYIGHRR
jgi:hypothetical protein